MGWISERHGQNGHSLNRDCRNNGSQRGPLRKIMDMVPDPKFGHYVMLELLECGHTMYPRSDIFGYTAPARRRCSKCKRELPPDQPSAGGGA